MTHGIGTYPLESTDNEPVDIEKGPGYQKAIATRDIAIAAKLDILIDEITKIRQGIEILLNQEIK